MVSISIAAAVRFLNPTLFGRLVVQLNRQHTLYAAGIRAIFTLGADHLFISCYDFRIIADAMIRVNGIGVGEGEMGGV